MTKLLVAACRSMSRTARRVGCRDNVTRAEGASQGSEAEPAGDLPGVGHFGGNARARYLMVLRSSQISRVNDALARSRNLASTANW